MRWSWAYAPFIVIGASFIANMVMISAAHRVRPEMVSDNPFLASRHFDADKDAEHRFVDAGYTLTVTAQPGEAHLVMSGTSVKDLNGQPAHLVAYRPDNAALDAVVIWNDVSSPLRIPLTAGGWSLRFSMGEGDDAIAVMRDVTIP